MKKIKLNLNEHLNKHIKLEGVLEGVPFQFEGKLIDSTEDMIVLQELDTRGITYVSRRIKLLAIVVIE